MIRDTSEIREGEKRQCPLFYCRVPAPRVVLCLCLLASPQACDSPSASIQHIQYYQLASAPALQCHVSSERGGNHHNRRRGKTSSSLIRNRGRDYHRLLPGENNVRMQKIRKVELVTGMFYINYGYHWLHCIMCLLCY